MANEQQRQPIEERIGSMVGKIIVLRFVLCFFGAIRQPYLAQVGLL
jgi:hypothetical protein